MSLNDEWRRHRDGRRRLAADGLGDRVPAAGGGSNAAALALMAGLDRAGLWVPAIRPPTVPAGTARLRIARRAGHEERDVELLLAALREAGEVVGCGGEGSLTARTYRLEVAWPDGCFRLDAVVRQADVDRPLSTLKRHPPS